MSTETTTPNNAIDIDMKQLHQTSNNVSSNCNHGKKPVLELDFSVAKISNMISPSLTPPPYQSKSTANIPAYSKPTYSRQVSFASILNDSSSGTPASPNAYSKNFLKRRLSNFALDPNSMNIQNLNTMTTDEKPYKYTQEEHESLAKPDLLKHGKIQDMSWWRWAFKDNELELLFRRYYYREINTHFQYLGLANIIWDIIQIIVYLSFQKYEDIPYSREEYNNITARNDLCYNDTHDVPPNFDLFKYGTTPRLIISIISFILFVMYTVMWRLDRDPPTWRRRAHALGLWITLLLINYAIFSQNPSYLPDSELGFTQFILFMNYTLIPVPLLWSFTMASFHSVLHLTLTISLTLMNVHFPPVQLKYQIPATVIILLAANLNGFYHNALFDLAQRRNFINIKQSVGALIDVNDEDKKREYLLLSIMPKYFLEKHMNVIMHWNKDTKREPKKGSIFQDLILDFRENVSILFADVVGFTKFSSTVEAKELIRLLNKLFGAFDHLAEEQHCQRIKILGDCYYCVSGITDDREDHADNCVRMGLAMCESIKLFQKETGCDLNMRVGVHSGRVYCGILGSRKIQFDIWSNDVIIANKMESGGLPGSVHISEKTKSLLKCKYDIQNGDGGSRNEYLRDMNTYLIWPSSNLTISSLNSIIIQQLTSVTPFSKESISIFHKEHNNSRRYSVGSDSRLASWVASRKHSDPDKKVSEEIPVTDTIITLREKRIRKEISESLKKMKWCETKKDQNESDKTKINTSKEFNSVVYKYTISFKTKELELCYQRLPDKSFKYYLLSSWFLHLIIFIVQMLVHPSLVALLFFVIGTVIFSILEAIYWCYLIKMIENVPPKFEWIKKKIEKFSYFMISNIGARYIVASLMIMIVMGSATVNLLSCMPININEFYTIIDEICIHENRAYCSNLTNGVFNDYIMREDNNVDPTFDNKGPCNQPQYFIYNAMLAMLAPSMFIGLNWLYKAVMNIIGFIVYLSLHLAFTQDYFTSWDLGYHGICTPTSSYFSLLERGLLWITIEFIALLMFERLTEKTNRVGFFWKWKAARAEKEITKTKEVHNNLLYNILPAHVAAIYLNKDNSEYYYDNHQNACVMFASIPEFDNIMFIESTDSNKQEKEWLRLLNEMFIEFDDLVTEDEFKGIEKIKTIGSTYMAASGLNELQDNPNEHIYAMAKFTFKIREILKEFSLSAFNNYKFRIGINVGPLVAGVIGAQKPMYDIWGDTVNIASRMDSTAMPGETQVTDTVAEVLRGYDLILESREGVSVKGKGLLTTYILQTPDNYDV